MRFHAAVVIVPFESVSILPGKSICTAASCNSIVILGTVHAQSGVYITNNLQLEEPGHLKHRIWSIFLFLSSMVFQAL